MAVTPGDSWVRTTESGAGNETELVLRTFTVPLKIFEDRLYVNALVVT